MGLYDAVQNKKRQGKRDKKQDDEVEKLRKRVDEAEERAKQRESKPRDEYGHNFQQSGMLIQREYDEGYGRLGNKFAIGDSEWSRRRV